MYLQQHDLQCFVAGQRVDLPGACVVVTGDSVGQSSKNSMAQPPEHSSSSQTGIVHPLPHVGAL